LIFAATKRHRKRKWSVEEQEAVKVGLGSFFSLTHLPGKDEIVKCINHHPALKDRAWTNVKDYVRNIQLRNSKFMSDKLIGCCCSVNGW